MPVDFAHRFFQLFAGDMLLVALGQAGTLHSIKKAGGECLGVGLDQPNETIQDHHNALPILNLVKSRRLQHLQT
jgi:hypothetical protein